MIRGTRQDQKDIMNFDESLYVERKDWRLEYVNENIPTMSQEENIWFEKPFEEE